MEDIVKFHEYIDHAHPKVSSSWEMGNIYYTAIVLRTRSMNASVPCVENFPVRYDLRVLEVVPELFKEETKRFRNVFDVRILTISVSQSVIKFKRFDPL